MAKTILTASSDRYVVGRQVIPWVHRRCGLCPTWFKFRYDEASREINEHGYFKVICPDCEHEFVYERVAHIPDQHMTFIEVD